jgi:23S rRNA (uracil1939-C5)-methyltransferase
MPQIKIDAMTFGPDAIGRLDGLAVMIPNAAPGDVVDVEITGKRRGHAVGKISRIVESSADRREPPCRFVARCGGCDWQHLTYPAQLRIKTELASSALTHALGRRVEVEVEPAPAELGYRSRIRLGCGRHGEIGFRELAGDQLVLIDECIVSAVSIDGAAQLCRALTGVAAEIEAVHSDGKTVLVAHIPRPLAPSHIDRAKAAMDASGGAIAGIVLRAKDRREIIGRTSVEIELESGLSIEADADVFSQVNRAQNIKLVAEVMSAAAPVVNESVLDLFCGAGNFSIPAARRGARVTGVDTAAEAIAAARANAARLGMPSAEFIEMKASQTAEFLRRARFRPDIVVLDPPRAGALELMAPVAAMKPRSIVYVSCDVTTLGRDLRELESRGYRIDRVRAFDFFPNTHHIEVAAHALLT